MRIIRGFVAGAAALLLLSFVVRSSVRGDVRVSAPEGERTPVVVELFTSEGCSSCPPADALLAQLVAMQPVGAAEIIGVGLHVDYWDQLGWRDRFSSAAFTSRQRAYGDALRVDAIYTPQMVVDGRAELVGSNAGAAKAAIERSARAPHGRLDLAIDSAASDAVAVRIAASGLPAPGKGDRDDVIVAVTEDGLKSDVARGENRGRTLAHASVARSLKVAGDVSPGTGAPQVVSTSVPLRPDWNRAHLNLVAFVQESRSRHIVAAAATSLAAAR